MPGWNLADVWETIATTAPERAALVHGDRRVTWAAFDRRAAAIAATLIADGAARDDKVAIYLHNRPEYLETTFAAAKVALVPVNTNYRYLEDELVYLWDNADAVAVVFEGRFADRIDAVRARVPKVRTWLWVDDDTGTCPDWAHPYEKAAESGTRPDPTWTRSGDDLVMIYTGGTTGIPKGVMWRHDDLFRAFNTQGDPDVADLGVVAERARRPNHPVGMPACPLMHGTGFLIALNQLNQAGTVVTLRAASFDAAELLDTVEREAVTVLAIVGDSFARPLVATLDEQPGRWDLTSLKLIMSSGVMWSAPVKQGLLRHAPDVLLADLLGSTEALGMGSSVTSGRGGASTASFELGANAIVLDDDDRPVVAGSGVVGRLAVKSITPVGYYKDPDKSARTFKEIDGERWSIPGDFATVETDGTLRLLGRGSVCINTGGEKVFPEEVEEALKTHPSVRDAIVVGVPDERFGEAICALVECHNGATTSEDLRAHVKSRMARYKAPRHVLIVDSLHRAPNGKADYAATRNRALEALAPDG
ncbi:MAG: AMP-binding protein [Actinobacteria bacterium]|nr:AMP-binding protein [Actinomycetota bacterium]